MKKSIHMKIKASENFWQKQMKKLTFIELRSEPIMLIGDELYIQGEPASTESEIIELSKQNPNEFLIATYIGEDHFENLVSTYRFQYGRRILIEEKYEYFFDISKEDLDDLPLGLYEKFQQLAVKYFQKGDKYRVRAYESDPTFQEMPVRPMEDKDDSIFVPSVELWEDGFKIQAKNHNTQDKSTYHSHYGRPVSAPLGEYTKEKYCGNRRGNGCCNFINAFKNAGELLALGGPGHGQNHHHHRS
mgnify:CR=1 FL=1